MVTKKLKLVLAAILSFFSVSYAQVKMPSMQHIKQYGKDRIVLYKKCVMRKCNDAEKAMVRSDLKKAGIAAGALLLAAAAAIGIKRYSQRGMQEQQKPITVTDEWLRSEEQTMKNELDEVNSVYEQHRGLINSAKNILVVSAMEGLGFNSFQISTILSANYVKIKEDYDNFLPKFAAVISGTRPWDSAIQKEWDRIKKEKVLFDTMIDLFVRVMALAGKEGVPEGLKSKVRETFGENSVYDAAA